MSAPPRLYTCTPKPFQANRGFFIRDTGLLCRVLREMGAESRVIMPLRAEDDDEPDAPLMRVPMRCLSSASWWRSVGLDGVVLYSWAAPCYTSIARAIHEAGIRLVVHLDATEEMGRPLPPTAPLWRRWAERLKEAIQMPRRRRHLSYADAVTISRAAGEKLIENASFGPDFSRKMVPMPCPVSPLKTYDGTPKEKRILCIGRWDDVWQKRPEMLMQTLECFERESVAEEMQIDIIGTLTEELRRWHAALPPAQRERIVLRGYVDNAELTAAYRAARICLCSSRFESSHIVSAEAVCCGCSIVTPPRPGQLTTVQGYTVYQSGRVAAEDTPQALAAALAEECRAWEDGLRNPAAIAEAWYPELHADRVLRCLFADAFAAAEP